MILRQFVVDVLECLQFRALRAHDVLLFSWLATVTQRGMSFKQWEHLVAMRPMTQYRLQLPASIMRRLCIYLFNGASLKMALQCVLASTDITPGIAKASSLIWAWSEAIQQSGA